MEVVADAAILETLAEDIRRQASEGLERLDVDRLLALAHWGRRQLERRFRDRYLTSPARFFRDRQTEIATHLLSEGDDVLSASVKSGFTSPGRLHDAVVTRYGLTPGEVRRRGAGVHIDFGFFQTQLGIVMLAATPRGLCSLKICGANPSAERLAERIAELHAEYPLADIAEETQPTQVYADQLVAYLESRADSFSPTLDVFFGTTFQREVWAELQEVKPGETITYAELAARIGHPRAVRAVANACAANNLAIAIPCHRALRQDGSLAGYRWGIEWKKRLLNLEAEMTHHRTPGRVGEAHVQPAMPVAEPVMG